MTSKHDEFRRGGGIYKIKIQLQGCMEVPKIDLTWITIFIQLIAYIDKLLFHTF